MDRMSFGATPCEDESEIREERFVSRAARRAGVCLRPALRIVYAEVSTEREPNARDDRR